MAGDGTQTRSICYVDDLADGVVRLLKSHHPGPVNIGNPHEISMNDLAQWIVRMVGSTSKVVHIERPVDAPTVRRPDITRARGELCWEPQVPIAEGLERTIAWFREQPRLVEGQ